MEDVLGWLLWLVVEVTLIGTGKGVVRVVSFGRWRGERMSRNEGRIYSAAGALSFKHEGQRVITVNGLLFVGVLFYAVLAVLLLW
ncbi:MAG: hypothetical protein KGL99_08035 [Burkholderiales bacterium]|nr:hypothetical protein [Burkholderiales bacterium]MDE2627085.1 hypothetical protein [Burkholderiales bacterium]